MNNFQQMLISFFEATFDNENEARSTQPDNPADAYQRRWFWLLCSLSNLNPRPQASRSVKHLYVKAITEGNGTDLPFLEVSVSAIDSLHPTTLRSYDVEDISKPKIRWGLPNWNYAARGHIAEDLSDRFDSRRLHQLIEKRPLKLRAFSFWNS